MKILLIDADSKIPNIALMKLSSYYKKKGMEVFLNNELCKPDKVFISKIFTSSEITYSGSAVIGGSGYDLKVELPGPARNLMPDYSLYDGQICQHCRRQVKYCKCRAGAVPGDVFYSMGFTTRGCIRSCKFCIVREKEGDFEVVADIYDFLDKRFKSIILLDNNILVDKKHFIKICKQIQKENLAVDFNQGLDIRLVDEEIAEMLGSVKIHKRVRFAFDDIKLERIIRDKMAILTKYIKPSKMMFYVLVGYDSTFEEDVERVRILKEFKVDPFVMKYHSNSKLLNEFARWSNLFYFRNVPFKGFLKKRNYAYLLDGDYRYQTLDK